MNYVLAILALGMLIVVHEAGHYIVAKLSGMKVERFSIGFGPGILKWRHKGTLFQIAPIPFGGFVQIVGMNPHEEFDDKDPSVYPNRPVLLRFLTIFAGPFTNVIFSTVLVFAVFVGAGAEVVRSSVAVVLPGAAAEGKLQPGDVLMAVDGQDVLHPGVSGHVENSGGRPLKLSILRGGTPQIVEIAPRKDDSGAWRLGIQLTGTVMERRKLGLGAATVASLEYPIEKSQLILAGLWDIVTGKAKPEVIGPVGMTKIIKDNIKAGWISAFEFLAILNVYLGLFNLLPLPALDGGRLVFLSYELATRRRPNPKVEAAVHMAGFVVLLVIMVLVMFKDIKNVVGG